MTKRTVVLAAMAALAAAIYVNNTSLISGRAPGRPMLLAHRGLAQDFSREGLTGDSCTAARMLPPRHAYLENTIASMEAAFSLSADAIELDVHPTTDGQFAVFHDWTLDCRTNGKGVTREHDLAYLKTLDIGYGYTADDGATFPFRGKGVGLMPSLDEVLAHFPGRRFHINIKSSDPAEGEALAGFLDGLEPRERARLTVYGGDAPIAAVEQKLPDMRSFSSGSLKKCALAYIAAGWSGYVPEACRKTTLLVPVNIAPWFWGWPNRFLDRMDAAGTQVFLLGPYHGGFSEGLNDPTEIEQLPAGYSGGISTDALDVVAPVLQRRGVN
ncbi:glycerophosphodiester phosphodiesterase family protein [Mesorhizobium sp. BAC0120]|uniref:glycerophosphodiester phosphodiesterase family protein n=1 Tax=Mesorhizobium sp. BAC0120 TaxID=3090670 RepID=UPI00298C5AF5|nr:glycerophosphodiester phosphodiesterase family protein [Mesorhizobium sp. BAC0120]MDW6021935.1 glycerophosphodiester phosphodiesterase family protein [Mesorhizobium sp. BAC0120]